MAEHSLRRRLVTVGVGVAVIGAAGGAAWAATNGPSTSYRLATAHLGSATTTLVVTGTIEPQHSADVDFQVSGTVGKVLVHQGQHVTAGQRLARLDGTALRSALSTARSTLARARAALSEAESGESGTVSTGSGETAATTSSTQISTTAYELTSSTTTTPHPSPSPSSSGTGGGTGAGSGLSSAITRDQAVVVAAQHRLDDDIAAATSALSAEKKACAGELGSGGTSPATEDCTAAATTLLDDQQTVSADETAVENAETALTDALTRAISSAGRTSTGSSGGATSSTPSSGDRSGSGSDGSHASSSTSTSGTSGGTASAASLASDEAAIDTARADVATARGDLAEAVIRAPIGGSVAAVTIAKGDSVSGSSSSTDPAVEIRGSHQAEVVADLSAAQVQQVELGTAATAVADGESRSLRGHVTAIGLTPVTSDSSDETASDSTSYPVTVSLAGAGGVVDGADAGVTFQIATARNVATVPTSAVRRSGGSYTVRVMSDGKVRTRTVTVGVVGASLTQITSGLAVGDRVVLADLDAAVPSSSTNQTTRGSFRVGAGFGGGTFTGGSFSGGPPGGTP